MKVIQLDQTEQKNMKKYAKQFENKIESENIVNPNSVYLLDTNILHLIIQNNLILEKIKNNANGKSVVFVLLEDLMSELYYMEKQNQMHDDLTFSSKKAKTIRTKLQKYGIVYEKNTSQLSDMKQKAKDLYDTKKYRGKNNKPLSKIGCMLVVYFQHHDDIMQR